jgi:phage terminase large subunit-like protein
VTRGTTYDNTPNLAGKFLETIIKKYAGTRLGRQELDGAILEDAPGALWTRERLDSTRVAREPKYYRRIVVSVDPSGTRGAGIDSSGARKKGGDDIGVLIVGLGDDGHGYVLDDHTTDLGPGQWGRVVTNAYHQYEADAVLGETNFGGDMVRHVIQSVDDKIPFKEVRSSRGKWLRAEPVAALYEQGRVHHVGSFSALEDEMCLFTAAGYTGGTSPDRTDALVFAITELMLDEQRIVTQQRIGVR